MSRVPMELGGQSEEIEQSELESLKLSHNDNSNESEQQIVHMHICMN